jgi:menaquinone-9 beta-reductase
VIVLEKKTYPFHKVCGEYVSNESYGFFKRIGLPLDSWDLPQINQLGISAPNGFMMESALKCGGFGLSRYKLDHELCLLAKKNGVTVNENTNVLNVEGINITTNKGSFSGKLIMGSFGKTSPVFAKNKNERLKDNYIGVKYHIKTGFPSNRIELHHFKKGYCGISRVENGTYCLCYLSHSSNLKDSNNSVPEMEERILMQNPHLKKIFENSDFLFKEPLTISNIKFGSRQTSGSNMLYIGDAAGCVSPLTGNGMSMAAYTSVILSGLAHDYLENRISYRFMQARYRQLWSRQFTGRINRGKFLQALLGHQTLCHLTLRALSPFGSIKDLVIRSTHGAPF